MFRPNIDLRLFRQHHSRIEHIVKFPKTLFSKTLSEIEVIAGKLDVETVCQVRGDPVSTLWFG